jgi:hypothetical protein
VIHLQPGQQPGRRGSGALATCLARRGGFWHLRHFCAWKLGVHGRDQITRHGAICSVLHVDGYDVLHGARRQRDRAPRAGLLRIAGQTEERRLQSFDVLRLQIRAHFIDVARQLFEGEVQAHVFCRWLGHDAQ